MFPLHAEYVYDIKAKENKEKAKINIAKSTKQFIDSIAKKESNNNWKAYNEFGYIGKYQFGRSALEEVGHNHVTFNDFVENPEIWPEAEQDKAMLKYMKIHEKYLSEYINEYAGREIQYHYIDSIETYTEVCLDSISNMDSIISIKITKSGIIAAAHLSGVRGVKNFFNKGLNPSDKFGTRLTDYLINYAGFNI